MIGMWLKKKHGRRVAEQARAWVLRRQASGFSGTDREQLAAWLQVSADHRAAFQRVNDLWLELEGVKPAFESLAELGVSREPVTRHAHIRSPHLIFAAAAVLTLIGGAAWTTSMNEAQPLRVYATEVGEIGDIRLADASHVKLGGKSTIKVMELADERHVELTSGEAYFEVTPDPNRPFIVDTATARIRVLGTKFNVHTGPAGVTVTVVDGHVAVKSRAAKADAEVLAATAHLTRGEEIEVAANGVVSNIATVDVAQAMAWQRGKLAFRNEALNAVVADVNRYSEQTLVIGDAGLANLRVTGLFQEGDFGAVVSVIEQTLPVRSTWDGSSRLTLWRARR